MICPSPCIFRGDVNEDPAHSQQTDHRPSLFSGSDLNMHARSIRWMFYRVPQDVGRYFGKTSTLAQASVMDEPCIASDVDRFDQSYFSGTSLAVFGYCRQHALSPITSPSSEQDPNLEMTRPPWILRMDGAARQTCMKQYRIL